MRSGKDSMNNNAGISLVSAMIIVVMVSILGLAVSSFFATKNAATSARLASMRAQFIAEGGLERGICQYKSNCSGYTGETATSLGGGQFTVQIFSTSFDGTTALSGQRRVRVTGAIPTISNPQGVKVIEQIATCPSSAALGVNSKANITLWNNSTVTCGSQICDQTMINNGTCTCAKAGSTTSMPAVTVPGGLNAPGGVCEYNGGNFTWQPGTYYCASLHLNTTSNISLNGAVTIYTSSFELNNSSTLNTSGLAKNLLVMVTAGGYAQFNSGSQFKGYLYAPGVNVAAYNGSVITGGVAAASMTMASGAYVVWDNTAGTSAPGYSGSTGGGSSGSDTTIDWRETQP